MVYGAEVSSQFVAFGGNSPRVFDTTEEILDLVPAAIDWFGTIGCLGRIASVGDGWNGCVVNLPAGFLAVIGRAAVAVDDRP